MKQIIYLTGFMGSGKSTIGPILANTLGWDFYDLDRIIEKKTGKKIREIFEQDGEDYFRKIETESLREVSICNKTIISLGGGTIASDENMAILKSSGKLFYLKMSMEAAYGRLKYKRDRPALKNTSDDLSQEELMNTIDDLMKKRKIYYEQADFTIDTDKSSVGKTVDRIVNIIFKAGLN
ncbi:MAG TPA: shikimate kinase [Ignavibacteriaceae bacterium]|nr:shikimate kinase [Ignavibacteriaceae bacterium]